MVTMSPALTSVGVTLVINGEVDGVEESEDFVHPAGRITANNAKMVNTQLSLFGGMMVSSEYGSQ